MSFDPCATLVAWHPKPRMTREELDRVCKWSNMHTNTPTVDIDMAEAKDVTALYFEKRGIVVRSDTPEINEVIKRAGPAAVVRVRAQEHITLQCLAGSSFVRYNNLADLWLHRCDISVLPKEISNLRALKCLRLSLNPHLTALPSSIGTLPNLKELYINSCDIPFLPNSFAYLKLKTLYAYNNQMVIPSAAMHTNQPVEVHKFMVAAKAKNQYTVPYAHVCFLGDANHGKSSLARTFLSGGKEVAGVPIPMKPIVMDSSARTVGASYLVATVGQKSVAVLVDLGGQIDYDNSHSEYIPANKSVFVLVWNINVDFCRYSIRRWLNLVAVATVDAQIMLVLTQCDSFQEGAVWTDRNAAMQDKRATFAALVREIWAQAGRRSKRIVLHDEVMCVSCKSLMAMMEFRAALTEAITREDSVVSVSVPDVAVHTAAHVVLRSVPFRTKHYCLLSDIVKAQSDELTNRDFRFMDPNLPIYNMASIDAVAQAMSRTAFSNCACYKPCSALAHFVFTSKFNLNTVTRLVVQHKQASFFLRQALDPIAAQQFDAAQATAAEGTINVDIMAALMMARITTIDKTQPDILKKVNKGSLSSDSNTTIEKFMARTTPTNCNVQHPAETDLLEFCYEKQFLSAIDPQFALAILEAQHMAYRCNPAADSSHVPLSQQPHFLPFFSPNTARIAEATILVRNPQVCKIVFNVGTVPFDLLCRIASVAAACVYGSGTVHVWNSTGSAAGVMLTLGTAQCVVDLAYPEGCVFVSMFNAQQSRAMCMFVYLVASIAYPAFMLAETMECGCMCNVATTEYACCNKPGQHNMLYWICNDAGAVELENNIMRMVSDTAATDTHTFYSIIQMIYNTASDKMEYRNILAALSKFTGSAERDVAIECLKHYIARLSNNTFPSSSVGKHFTELLQKTEATTKKLKATVASTDTTSHALLDELQHTLDKYSSRQLD